MLSIHNQTYRNFTIAFLFTVDKQAVWIKYSLDGKENVTIAGNTTLSGLANGFHNVTVYANDNFGNVGASQTINFIIAKPEPFSIAVVAAVSGVVAIVFAALLIYLKKRKR